MNLEKIPLASDRRYFPFIVAMLIILSMLLFFKELTDPIKQSLFPSLVVYAIMTGFLGYLQDMWQIRHTAQASLGENYINLKNWQWRFILTSHILLIIFLIAYNVYKGIL